MRLSVTSQYVTVELAGGFRIEEKWHDAELTFTNVGADPEDEAYMVKVYADTPDQLRALIAAAELEGQVTRTRVENVIKRTEELFDEWMAELTSQECK